MRIGLLSDTHLPGLIRSLDELGPEPARFFSAVDLILHAGDLTSPMVLDWLEQFAPVLCTTGNNDPIADPRCQDVQVLDVHGWRIGMVHSLKRGFRPVTELQKIFPAPVDIIVAGDTHQELLAYREGVVVLNSGSPTFPQQKELRLGTVGLLELTSNHLHAEIVVLGQTPGRPNPGKAMTLQIQDGHVTRYHPPSPSPRGRRREGGTERGRETDGVSVPSVPLSLHLSLSPSPRGGEDTGEGVQACQGRKGKS